MHVETLYTFLGALNMEGDTMIFFLIKIFPLTKMN